MLQPLQRPVEGRPIREEGSVLVFVTTWNMGGGCGPAELEGGLPDCLPHWIPKGYDLYVSPPNPNPNPNPNSNPNRYPNRYPNPNPQPRRVHISARARASSTVRVLPPALDRCCLDLDPPPLLARSSRPQVRGLIPSGAILLAVDLVLVVVLVFFRWWGCRSACASASSAPSSTTTSVRRTLRRHCTWLGLAVKVGLGVGARVKAANFAPC